MIELQLTKSAIRYACGDAAVARGTAYAKDQRVLSLDLHKEAEYWTLHARVEGRHVYEQKIRLCPTRKGVDIDGECTCPASFNCKHVAAALVELMAQRDPDARDPEQIQKWLQELADTQTPLHWHPDPGDQVLLYLLKPRHGDRGDIEVQVELSRVLRNQRAYGVPKRVWMYETSGAAVRRAMQPIDAEILGLLTSMTEFSCTLLQGRVGALALQPMLHSGRLHWQSINAPPLSESAPRALRLEWRAENGFLRLVSEAGCPGTVILPTEPPAFLDPSDASIGTLLLEPGLAHRELSVLLRAPRLRADMAMRLSERLLDEFPALPIPLPAQSAMRLLRDLMPVPILRLSATPQDRQPHPGTRHAAILRFDYAGQHIGLPTSRAGRGKDALGAFHFLRDTSREHAAVSQLLSLGFELRSAAGVSEPLFHLIEREALTAATRWRSFLDEEIPRLREQGWRIETDVSFNLRFLRAPDPTAELIAESDWFDLAIGLEIAGRHIDLIPILAQLSEQIEDPESLDEAQSLLVEVDEDEWIELQGRQVKPLLRTLFDLFDRSSPTGASLRLTPHDAARLQGLDDGITWRGGEALRELAKRLVAPSGLAPTADPVGLQAQLRPYQRQGLAWLQLLRDTGFGGVLADDMGLGKTLQSLANLLMEQRAGRLVQPALVVAPTSLMANWRHEATLFAPTLRVLTLHGPRRKDLFASIPEYDLVLTSYPLLLRDIGILALYKFHYLILDEAQVIKNPRARITQIVSRLQARHRLCLTGTPMENHLGELWSLFQFIAPGYLGDSSSFRRLFRSPIETRGDARRRLALQQRIGPFMLRRTKEAVATELPGKQEIVRSVALHSAQAALYESVRAAMDKKIREVLRHKGLARSHITILDALLKLRQICCDPRLLKLDRAHKVEQSAKLDLLMEMLPQLIAEGRRILVFSQFTSMLTLIAEALAAKRISFVKLTGQTRNRQQVIDAFQNGCIPIFLISLKAGGVGLNLTRADTVIHYDPWWNPAVERQATDRAHRIGQANQVFVYKLVGEQTVEEKILALQTRKAKLTEGIYREPHIAQGPVFSEKDLQELLLPLQ